MEISNTLAVCSSTSLIPFSNLELSDVVGADLLKRVQELVHFSILLIEVLIILLVLFFGLLILKRSLQVTQFLLVDVNVLLDFFGAEQVRKYLFSMLEMVPLSSFMRARMRSLASGTLRLD